MEDKLFDIITNTPYGTKTYGDVFEEFGGGKFKYIAYTD